MKRVIAAALSAFVVLGCPGLPVGQVVAQVFTAHPVETAPLPAVSMPVGAMTGPAAAASLPSLASPLTLPAALPSLAGAVRAARAPAATAQAARAAARIAVAPALALPAAAARLAAPARAVSEEAAPGRAPAAKAVSALSRQVASALASAGPVAQAGPGDARALGTRLEDILTGWRSAGADASAVAPQNGSWESPSASGDHAFAQPAGRDSIAAAVRDHNAHFAAAPVPAAQGVTPAPQPRRAPFLPKLISAGLAAAPALAVGLPLLAAGSTLAGGAVLAASAAMMALPFLGQGAPAFLRAAPGAALLGLGALTAASAALGGAPYWAAALVALGGWGLLRYGLKADQEDRYDHDKALSAYFGGLGAVALAGLGLAGAGVLLPAWGGVLAVASHGWFLTGATAASAVLSAMLLLHLPGWVGDGMGTAFQGVYTAAEGAWRVMGSLKRDTVLFDRLMSFTRRQLDRSPWNAIWLSGVWIPVWLSEAAMFALSLVGGVAFGALMAPTMFSWGAVHALWEKSAATRFLAAWNRFVLDWTAGSKTRVYNRVAKPLAALANRTHGPVSIAAGLGLRLAQLGWLAGTLAAAPFVWIAGFFRAFGTMDRAYDYGKDAPSSLRVDVNDRPDVPRPTDPTDPTQPGKSTFVPRLIASGIALTPFYFLGLPLWGVPVLGQLYALTGLALAAMPFLPASAPKLLKQLPGYLLIGLGLLSTAAVPYFLFGDVGILSLVGHNAIWMGLVTALSGWGMVRYTGSLGAKDGQKWYSVDDPEYIGAFFGALGVTAALGASVLGLTGWLPLALKVGGYATSLLLLMHLPAWMGDGVRAAADGVWRSGRAFDRVAGFWREDTKFYGNMSRHASYWLDKSVWNASWLSVVWVPTWAVMLAEWAASAALGLVYGVLRAPLNFAWGAAYGISHDAKGTRFIAGLARGSFARLEGSKKAVFDRWVAPLVPAMNEADPVSGRPTAKAALALLAARFVELAWLLRVTLGLPVLLGLSVADGFKNAVGAKPKPVPGQWQPDQDDPRNLY